MNAIKFILKEHAKIRAAFKLIAKSNSSDAVKIRKLMALCKYLVVHETMEQKLWYPYLKANTKLTTVIKHLVSEEKTAAKVIERFKKMKKKTDWENEWEDKFEKFKDDVDHHADEEDKKLFPKVVLQVDETELRSIGKKLQAFTHQKLARKVLFWKQRTLVSCP